MLRNHFKKVRYVNREEGVGFGGMPPSNNTLDLPLFAGCATNGICGIGKSNWIRQLSVFSACKLQAEMRFATNRFFKTEKPNEIKILNSLSSLQKRVFVLNK